MAVRQHLVATSYVYDRVSDRFLLLFHRKLGKWLPPGGHLNEGEAPHEGALRELWEETGLRGQIRDMLAIPDVRSADVAQLPAPLYMLAEPIPANAREEEHIHLDCIYVVEVEVAATLTLCQDEVAGARWVDGAQLADLDTFENVRNICQAIRTLSR
jgi:8-oxo-dGTP pyrophosphatase MutT (NUDIX family)